MTKQKVSHYLLVFILSVIAFQYSSFGIIEEVYYKLRTIIIVSTFLMFIVTYKNPINCYRKVPVFKIHLSCLFFVAILQIVFYAFGANISFSSTTHIATSLIVLIIGLNFQISEKMLNQLITLYIILITLSAISIVFTQASGFVILAQYLDVPKNQQAPVFGTAVVLALYVSYKENGGKKILFYTLAGLLFASLLVIRGRAAIVSVFITFAFYIFYYIKNKKIRFLFIVLILIVSPFVGQFVYDAMFLNRDISDIDSFSAGRMERNIEGVQFLMKYPLTGELMNNYPGAIIHNYVLLTLVSSGLLIASITLIIYFKYVFVVINAIRNNSFYLYEVGPLVFLILLIVSLFEPSIPYSPGSTVFLPFFLMGVYLNKKTHL